MSIDLRQFARACNPNKKLNIANPDEKKYYIDFSSVRGGKIIEDMRFNITDLSPDEPQYQLFTGHIGCGKSTELLSLKSLLEQDGFHVVYFESHQDLEMSDIEITDILLAIAVEVDRSLEERKTKIAAGSYIKELYDDAVKFLKTEVDLEVKLPVPGVGDVTLKDSELSLSTMFGTLSAKTKSSPGLRKQLRQYWEPRTSNILKAINKELLEPAAVNLKETGSRGLVVIVDSLDMIDSSTEKSGKPQPEYIFVDQGEQLKRLNCHMIYTISLGLRFSNAFLALKQRFDSPYTLPMVPVVNRDRSENKEGMSLLRKMILTRALPYEPSDRQLESINEIFDSEDTFNKLCRISGGHVRNLLRLIISCIRKERAMPITMATLDDVIKQNKNELKLAISDDEWQLLRQVNETNKVQGDEGFQQLIRSMFVFEYHDNDGPWFDLNPLLKDAEELK